MKQQTQHSLLKWASLLCNKELTSIIQIQNTTILIKLLNILQPMTFQQLYQIDERSSNSVVSILKAIDKYFKKELRCNVSEIIENLNIFKTPIIVWQLLIGVAIKGKNRDTNINAILQMDLQQQSQLMLLVQDVIEKFTQYEIKNNPDNNNLTNSLSSSSSDQIQDRQRKLSRMSNQVINEIVQENEGLKQKVFELQNQLTQQKASHQRVKKMYQQRLNQLKSERYQFLEVLTGGSSGIQSKINRSRKSSQFKFRDSIISNSESQSRILDDPLHDLSISITGTLAEIAGDMLNAIKNLKKELAIQQQKASLFEDHLKDVKLSFNPLIQQNKLLKCELQKGLKLQKQCNTLKQQNEQLLKNETQMIKIISQVQEQKHYLREMVDKLKEEKSQLVMMIQKRKGGESGGSGKGERMKSGGDGCNIGGSSKDGMLDIDLSNNRKSTQKIDLVRAPSFILRQMNSQIEMYPSQLNQQIEHIKTPLMQQKYEKQMLQLRQKNNILRQQNNELKQMNKMLQKTIHKSMQKSQQIQKNIEEGYKALFDIQSEIAGKSLINSLETNKMKQNDAEKKQPLSPVEITISQSSNLWNDNDNDDLKKKNNPVIEVPVNNNNQQQDNNNNTNKLMQFYQQMKKTLQSYQQKQLLMIIEIESLKKQVSDLLLENFNLISKQNSNMREPQKVGESKNGEKKQKRRVTFNLERQNDIVIGCGQQQVKKQQQMCDYQELERTVTGKQTHQQEHELREQENKQDVVIINISTPGAIGEASHTQNQQIFKFPKNKTEEQYESPHRVIKKSKEIYPSVEFLQIQQGEEFNENQLPIRKSQQNSEDENQQQQGIKKDQSQGLLLKYNNTQLPDFLRNDFMADNHHNDDDNVNNNIDLSTISGIGIGTSNNSNSSNNMRRSYFSKSGFYNSSFIELSNKLQIQLEQDMNEITHEITHKKNRNMLGYFSNERIQQQIEQESRVIGVGDVSNHSLLISGKPKQVEMQQQQNSLLVNKLNNIKQSYEKIKQFHLKSTKQLQSQLKSQLSIQASQLTKLKVTNEQLKQSLTLMIGQKKVMRQKMNKMKELIKTANKESAEKKEQSQESLLPIMKLATMLQDISELENILPQLQASLEQSKVNQLQTLYRQQQLRNKHLSEEIQILLESIVYFRNLAICCCEDDDQ